MHPIDHISCNLNVIYLGRYRSNTFSLQLWRIYVLEIQLSEELLKEIPQKLSNVQRIVLLEVGVSWWKQKAHISKNNHTLRCPEHLQSHPVKIAEQITKQESTGQKFKFLHKILLFCSKFLCNQNIFPRNKKQRFPAIFFNGNYENSVLLRFHWSNLHIFTKFSFGVEFCLS